MLRFFPSSFLDETLYSRMARYHRLAGHNSDRLSLHELLGTHTHVIATALPSRLADFVSNLPSEAGYTVERVIRESTPFSYFTAFMPGERIASAFGAMSGESSSGLKMALGMTASRLGGRNYLRLCPYCKDDDRVTCGQAYWHRLHQLPGVWACPIHRVPLFELDREAVELKRQKLLLPDDSYVDQASAQIAVDGLQLESVLRISSLTEAVLQQTLPDDLSADIYSAHRNNARDLQLLQQNGRVRVNCLRKVLEGYRTSLPASGEYADLQENLLEWALRLLRKPRGNHVHPLKHILLLDCLRKRPSVTCRQSESRVDLCSQVVEPQCARVKIDCENVANLMKSEAATLTSVAASLHISVTTVAVAAARAGFSYSARPKHIFGALRQEAWASLRAGLSPSQVAAKCGISISSVYRLLRMDAELELSYQEKRFVAVREIYRDRYLHSHDDLAAYAWLRRNDPRWLAGQIVKGRPNTHCSDVDWAFRDRQKSEQISKAASELLLMPGRPRYISKAMLLRSSGIGETIRRNLNRLPLISEALARNAESPAEYQNRRLKWALIELKRSSSPPPPRWLLMRTAGVRRLFSSNDWVIAACQF